MLNARPPLFAIGLLSGAALGYEILLMRLLSIIQWHHFAYMIISLALLGYGFSGTLISLIQNRVQRHFEFLFIGTFVFFAISSIGCFALAQTLPFHPEALLWDYRQLAYLTALFLLLCLPFFFAASAFCLAFMRYGRFIASVYAFDLVGAGLGALLVIVLLFLMTPLDALLALSLVGLAAAIIAIESLRMPRRYLYSLTVALVAAGLAWSAQYLQLNLSQYKELRQTLQVQDTQIIDERSSPLGLLSVVQSGQIPLRHAPGLSLNAASEPPAQLGVFIDGGNMSAITHWEGKREKIAYLDQLTSALPYHLTRPARVLILGAGPGSDVLQAWYHHARQIDAVELNPQMVDLVRTRFGAFSGQLYDQPFVQVQIEDIRRFLARPQTEYDIMQLALIDGFNASASGLYALNESYLYTREALEQYIQHLTPDGYLSITRWVKLPPRDTLKLFATAVDALRAIGINEPGRHLLLIRSWQTSTLLVKRSTLTAKDMEKVRAFCRTRAFDLAYYPGIRASEVNQFNILKEPYLYQGTQAILSEQRRAFVDDYKFNLIPATDDRPFFHQFFKWSSLSEILSLRGQGGLPLLEWGYLVLVATLLIAFAVSLVLILLPTGLLKRQQAQPAINRLRMFGYFFAIGLGFLFIEIAFIQKFILVLHHPTYAVSVVLTAFLIFSGLGAHYSARLTQRLGARRGVQVAVLFIIVLSSVNLLVIEQYFSLLLQLETHWKIIISLGLIAPLAFFMGMPFPLALAEVARGTPAYIPWAWAVNGFASVISAVLATLLAIHWGFSMVVLLALALYAILVLLFPQGGAMARGKGQLTGHN